MSKHWRGRAGIVIAAGLAAVAWIHSNAGDKKYATLTNAEAQKMLDQLQVDIKENFYDPPCMVWTSTSALRKRDRRLLQRNLRIRRCWTLRPPHKR